MARSRLARARAPAARLANKTGGETMQKGNAARVCCKLQLAACRLRVASNLQAGRPLALAGKKSAILGALEQRAGA